MIEGIPAGLQMFLVGMVVVHAGALVRAFALRVLAFVTN